MYDDNPEEPVDALIATCVDARRTGKKADFESLVLLLVHFDVGRGIPHVGIDGLNHLAGAGTFGTAGLLHDRIAGPGQRLGRASVTRRPLRPRGRAGRSLRAR